MSGQAPGLLLGTKYQPALCYLFVFKILFLIVTIFLLHFTQPVSFGVLKLEFYIFYKEFSGFFLMQGHAFGVTSLNVVW